MPSTSKSEHELVQQCMTILCRKSGFANCGELVQRDLEFLSDDIHDKTGVLISTSTLRRLAKGQYSRIPQVATLNAIAIFAGFENWQDFKTKNATASPEILLSENGHSHAKASTRNLKWLWLAGILVIIGLSGMMILLKHKATSLGNLEKATFSMTRTTNTDIPNTVVFHYDVEHVNADSFFIQQSWDRNRRVRIDKHNHTLTDIYYEPGYHIAKLIANDSIIKTIDVSIPTGRWFFYSKEMKHAAIPAYIQPAETDKDLLAIKSADLLKAGLDTSRESNYIYCYFPFSILYSSDNYTLEFRARVHQLRNNLCSYLMPEIFCQRYFMYFISKPKGCAGTMTAQYGDHVIDGKTNDLSALATDFHDWQHVKIETRDKKVRIFVNDSLVFSTTYQANAGMITGLGFISNGLPDVKDISFTDQHGASILPVDFMSRRGARGAKMLD